MEIDVNLLLKLHEIRDNLTAVGRKIDDYVLENTAEIPRLSVNELATKSRTSDASVLRFCKYLGYDGYRQFIVNMSASIGMVDENAADPYTDIQPGDELATIINNVSLSNRKSIEDTMSIIDRDEIAKAVNVIDKAVKIDFYGVGASGIVCMDAQQKFMRINKMCHAYIDGHSQLTAATLLKRGDIAVAVSNSGTTIDILDSVDIAKRCGATVIAITRYKKSELAEKADIVLSISAPEFTMRSAATGSRIAMLNVIDILFMGVASGEYKDVKKYLVKTHNVLIGKHKR